MSSGLINAPAVETAEAAPETRAPERQPAKLVAMTTWIKTTVFRMKPDVKTNFAASAR